MTLYFYDSQETDYAWSTLANWWTDAAHTVQASALPAATDDVVIDSYIGSLGAARTVANATFNDGTFLDDSESHTLNVTGVCTFNEGVNQSTAFITGDCVFNGSSYNGGSITGDCTFNGTSYNRYGTITGDCTFNDSSYSSGGTITGDCTFNADSSNSGSITGNCTFNADSSNSGDIYGNCVFNGSSYNNWGLIYGDCVFNGGSYNAGTIDGTIYLRMRAAEFVVTWLAGSWTGSATTTVIQFREMDVIGTGLG
jgi:hypothetical protein